MEIRRAQPSDQSEIGAVVAAAFGEDTNGRVVEMIRALDGSGATRISLIAVDGGIVGHVQLNRSWVDTRRRLVEVLTLTPLSVVPNRQRQGIGTRLLAEALAEADRRGIPSVFLEGDREYYSARGFVSATLQHFVRPSHRIPEPAFQVALLSNHEEWMIGQVVFPDALWDTDCVGLRDPLLADIEGTQSIRKAK